MADHLSLLTKSLPTTTPTQTMAQTSPKATPKRFRGKDPVSEEESDDDLPLGDPTTSVLAAIGIKPDKNPTNTTPLDAGEEDPSK